MLLSVGPNWFGLFFYRSVHVYVFVCFSPSRVFSCVLAFALVFLVLVCPRRFFVGFELVWFGSVLFCCFVCFSVAQCGNLYIYIYNIF